MSRLAALLIAIVFMSVVSPCNAKDKQDMLARTDEAGIACGKYIVANAKDPDSIKFDEDMKYGFGSGLFRDHVYIWMNGVGRNTYGAVLRHSWECDLKCHKGTPCTISNVTDN